MAYQEPSNTAIDWIARSVGPGTSVETSRRLSGATSSNLYAVDCRRHGRSIPLVLRLFTDLDWLAVEPDLAAHEASNLVKAGGAGLPTPELVAFDPTPASCGVPAVLMTRLPGAVELLPTDFHAWLTQQAEVLFPLHALDATGYPWRYAPYNRIQDLRVPGWSTRPELWEKAIEIVSGPWPPFQPCFIHRDYHPVNVLFEAGRLSGVVDWPNACEGPGCIDLSWSRANLAGMYGVAAADQLLQVYTALAGAASDYHPFWDLMVIIEALPGPPSVYPPHIDFGLRDLNAALALQRSDEYLASVLAKL